MWTFTKNLPILRFIFASIEMTTWKLKNKNKSLDSLNCFSYFSSSFYFKEDAEAKYFNRDLF
jgi:hypothetical protein